MSLDPIIAAQIIGQSGAPTAPELATADDLAIILRVSRRTVYRMRARGELPAPVEVSRSIVRWRMSEVREFLRDLRQRSPRRRS